MYVFVGGLLADVITTTPSSSIGIAELALAGSALTVVGVIIAALITARRSSQMDATPLITLATKHGELQAQIGDMQSDLSRVTSELADVKKDVREEVGGLKTMITDLHVLVVHKLSEPVSSDTDGDSGLNPS